ncbi:c-type cytochrome [Aquabacterium sp.]|uniref:c-type cytochrome n=1 Tax=Aquabacterium sp. TaxID=1872578 RepID=UPI0039C86236
MKTRSRLAFWGVATLTPLAMLTGASAWAQTAKPGDPAAAQKKVAMCIGCHGIPGYQASFPEVHKVPMISGQNAKYIAAALLAYQKGDRKHPTMKGIAASLSEQDIADLAAYYEASGKNLPATPAKGGAATPEVTALLNKGACASCHGDGLNQPRDASYPKLAGQHADYLYVALKSYQTDKNAKIGRSNAIMAGQVKQFTLAELKLLANHIGGLGGDLKTVPQAKFK